MPLLETIGSGSARGLGFNSFKRLFPLGYGQYAFNNNGTNSGTTGSMTAFARNASYTTNPVKFGSHAAQFDGTGDYAQFNIPANSYTHTIAFWVYVRDTSLRSYIVDFRTVDAQDVGYWLYDDNGTATFGGSSEYTFNYNPPLNTWTHWALVTNQASNTVTWYQNGQVLASASRLCKTGSNGIFTFATYSGSIGGDQNQYYSNFVVDNMYISELALSPIEITSLYNSQVSF